MRIPVEINRGEILENMIHPQSVVTEKDGTHRLSPFFALGYFTLLEFLKENEGVIPDAEYLVSPVESDVTYETYQLRDWEIGIRDIFTYLSDKQGVVKNIPQTHLLEVLLDYFPVEYFQERIILSSRSSHSSSSLFPKEFAYLSRIFGTYNRTEASGLFNHQIVKADYRNPLFITPEQFRGSYAVTAVDNPPAIKKNPKVHLSNIAATRDMFNLITVAVLVIAGSKKLEGNENAMDLLINASRLQRQFVEEAQAEVPKRFVREYMLKRMTGEERRELVAYKRKKLNPTIHMIGYADDFIPNNVRISHHVQEKSYVTYIRDMLEEEGVSGYRYHRTRRLAPVLVRINPSTFDRYKDHLTNWVTLPADTPQLMH